MEHKKLGERNPCYNWHCKATGNCTCPPPPLNDNNPGNEMTRLRAEIDKLDKRCSHLEALMREQIKMMLTLNQRF